MVAVDGGRSVLCLDDGRDGVGVAVPELEAVDVVSSWFCVGLLPFGFRPSRQWCTPM